MKKTFFILSMLLLLSMDLKLYSQEYRKITTDVYQKSAPLNTSTVINDRAGINKQIGDFKKNAKFKKVTLPMVFHVLHRTGSAYPEINQVLGQLDALNRDFDKKSYKSKHKADSIERFTQKVADPEIQFCMALQDPTGKTTNGINLVNTSIATWGMNQDIKSTQKGGITAWNTAKYINVWVADLGSESSGYAQLPGGPTETDGIVIDYKYFGSEGTAKAPYNLGKTLTHLMGNYLGLQDLWGACYCCDDGIEDTPIHNAPNYGPTDVYKHVTTCDGITIEMSMNFMDNTDDDWMYMFTHGQKLRMQAVLSDIGPRVQLVNNNIACSKKLNESVEARESLALQADIYPNPADQSFNLSIQSNTIQPVHIKIINTLGQLILTQKIMPIKGLNQVSVDAGKWPSGMYHVLLEQGNQRINQKLVIQ